MNVLSIRARPVVPFGAHLGTLSPCHVRYRTIRYRTGASAPWNHGRLVGREAFHVPSVVEGGFDVEGVFAFAIHPAAFRYLSIPRRVSHNLSAPRSLRERKASATLSTAESSSPFRGDLLPSTTSASLASLLRAIARSRPDVGLLPVCCLQARLRASTEAVSEPHTLFVLSLRGVVAASRPRTARSCGSLPPWETRSTASPIRRSPAPGRALRSFPRRLSPLGESIVLSPL